MAKRIINQNKPDCPVHTHGTGDKRMDNTRLVITESFKTANKEERRKYIQTKVDNYLKKQLER